MTRRHLLCLECAGLPPPTGVGDLLRPGWGGFGWGGRGTHPSLIGVMGSGGGWDLPVHVVRKNPNAGLVVTGCVGGGEVQVVSGSGTVPACEAIGGSGVCPRL